MTDARSPLGNGGSHPEEALAAFTDGTATPDERAAVLQHLQGCDRCRREVELARGAVAAMASLPDPPSPGLDPGEIVRRAGNVTGIDSRRPPGQRRRVGAIAAGLVAAAVVAAAFAGLTKLGGGNQASTAGGAGSPALGVAPPEAGPSHSASNVYGMLTRDLTPAAVDRLAADEAAAAQGHEAAPAPGRTVTTKEASDASACADRTAGAGRVIRIFLASFQGRAAYVTLLRQTEGGQEAVRAVVTDRTDCAVLYATSHPVGG